jgi:Peptidase family M49
MRLLVTMLVMTLAADAPDAAGPPPDAVTLKKLAARLTPVELRADAEVAKLPASERAALVKILQAAKVMDALFLRQVWGGNQTVLLDLLSESSLRTPLGRERLHAFLQNKGPWLRLDHDRPFMPGVPPKPEAGSFYPAGSSKAEIEKWLGTLTTEARPTAEGFFTTIRRAGNKLIAVPYSLEYQPELAAAAALLDDAAQLTTQPTLKAFLEARAAAFLSNDYYASDVAWMKLDASIEPTIGPYEVYEDGWFNAKAAFEAFVTLRDDAETAKLAKFSGELQDIENHLPIDPKLRNPKIGAMAPIRVVNSIFSSGDANRGVQTAAFNLPNDERIAKEMGTKRTMLKNVQEAKFAKVLVPISKVVLAPADRSQVTFQAFFTHILMHELMHGLGPHEVKQIKPAGAGKPGTVRAALQDAHSSLEEAKADISGLFALQHLIDKGVIDRAMERPMYTTFLASAFRSLRFGLGESHGKGVALQLNTLLDAGAFRVDKAGTFSVDLGKVKDAVKALTGEIMAVQAAGDRKRAQELLRTRAVIRPEVQRVLDRLQTVPVDIEPRYTTAAALLIQVEKN